MMQNDGLYIILISIHGLIRSDNMELGRDSDTGGQIKYVVELARSLIQHPDIGRVDLLTRAVTDSKIPDVYTQPREEIAKNANIIRLPFGPRRYLRKEVLWPHLDSFTDQALYYIRQTGLYPHIIHGHYADAGYVASRLAGLLEVPMIQTGHSLGRIKLQRLVDQGVKKEYMENHYNIRRRIEAEEITLDSASKVIASTNQEVTEQYSLYDNYQPKRMVIIPPGVELDRFYPPKGRWTKPPIQETIDRFLKEPQKPMILAISRPDPRKNISTLIHAYGKSKSLRQLANLIIIAGNREDIATTEKGTRGVLTELLLLIDRYDLYGQIAYPKSHDSNDIPDLYRLAAKRQGVLINPALTEPFGLTLIEAAASGLPIVATRDGGPQDIIARCKNGLLIDPLDEDAMAETLIEALSDKERWRKWSKSGIIGAKKHFTWSAHVQKYVREVKKLVSKGSKRNDPSKQRKANLVTADRFVICDIDNTLLGDKEGLQNLKKYIRSVSNKVSFGIATGRRIESAVQVLKKWKAPTPDVLITSVGSEIHYGPRLVKDLNWEKHINRLWKPDAVYQVMKGLPGIIIQKDVDQRKHKISYYIDPDKSPTIREIKSYLRKEHLHVNVVYSHQQYLDILPIRASKGLAVRYFALKWGLPFEHILVAGDSGNDEEMLRGNTLAIVVGNYSSELEKLRGDPHIFFAKGRCAWGITEGINYYNFFA